jgi:nicotinamidase-related amidase
VELSGRAALVVVDMQVGFEDPAWGIRNNPRAELHTGRLLAFWRMTRRPVFYIRHDSTDPKSTLRPMQRGNAIKSQVAPAAGEKIIAKKVNSAFIGTTLQADLQAARSDTVVLVGLTTNHCVSTTARMAANFGFTTLVVSDATAAFAGRAYNGRPRTADEVHLHALSDLQGEFATIMETGQLLEANISQ